MFKKLRNKWILINLGITSFILIAIFTTIYFVVTKTAENRPLKLQEISTMENPGGDNFDNNNDGIPDDMENVVMFSVREEKKNAATSLLITLIATGVAVEIVVAIVSFILAEEAIKPVKEAYEAQKIFIANASHEIKTPLAAISANLEAADIKDNKWIKNVEFETAKLTALNNSLLSLARTGVITNTEVTEADLRTVTLQVLDSFEPRLKGKVFNRKITLGKKRKINAQDYGQIITILMDNAIKYSEKNVSVELSEHAFSVTNDGTKISPEKLPHVFDRFYQTDKTAEGVGLGLSIAKSLADRNNWRICVKSGKNTVFTLYF